MRTMSQCDSILPMIAAMKKRPDCILLEAETLHKMFDHHLPELVSQVISEIMYFSRKGTLIRGAFQRFTAASFSFILFMSSY